MGALEIFLLIAGAILIAATYIFSEKFSKDNDVTPEIGKNAADIAREIVKKEVETQISLLIDDKIEDANITLNKIVNEKMLSLGSYTDEISTNIEKNHNEVMFLYNMLNDKEKVLKDTIRDIEALKLSIKKMAIVNDMAAEKSENKDKIDKIDNENNEFKEEKKESLRTHNPTSVNNNAMILKLFKDGKSNIEIAKELGLGMGEVRLVIDLFKKES